MSSIDLDYQMLRPDQVEHLLNSHGWHQIKKFEGRASVWQAKSGRTKRVPLNQEFADYEQSLEDLIEAIAEEEGQSLETTKLALKQLYNDKDLVRIRVNADDIRHGNINYQDGKAILNTFNEVIKNTLRTVTASMKEFKENYIENCELSQTQVGSYVVNAYLPLLQVEKGENTTGQQDLVNSAFGRAVSLKLKQRLLKIKDVIERYEESNSGNLVFELMLEGFTQKECEAIESLYGQKGHRDWEIDFIWSQLIEGEDKTHISFMHNRSTTVHKLSKHFRRISEHKDITLQGMVEGMQRRYGKQNGHMKLRTAFSDKAILVSVTLSQDDYHTATEAHDLEKWVEITGVLSKRTVNARTYYYMKSVKRLKILNEDIFESDKNGKKTLDPSAH